MKGLNEIKTMTVVTIERKSTKHYTGRQRFESFHTRHDLLKLRAKL